jgi:hypothetical protein
MNHGDFDMGDQERKMSADASANVEHKNGSCLGDYDKNFWKKFLRHLSHVANYIRKLPQKILG